MVNISDNNGWPLMHNWMFDNPGDDFPQPPLSSVSTSIKTINGLAIGSVKTVNGLAIASVKSWNGLA